MDPDLKPYLNDVFPARTCEDGCKYLRGRLQVLAGKVAYISVEDAVHCEDGCSALRGRLQCTASEMGKTGTEIASPILDKRKGKKTVAFLTAKFTSKNVM